MFLFKRYDTYIVDTYLIDMYHNISIHWTGQVSWKYFRENIINHLHKAESLAHEIKPNIVVIDIGSNNVAQLTAAQPSTMLNHVHIVFTFGLTLKVGLVIFNAIQPRTTGIRSTPDIFL